MHRKPSIQTPFETGLGSSIFRCTWAQESSLERFLPNSNKNWRADYAGWCDKIQGESYPTQNGFMRIIRREPIGVCAGIFAFNGSIVQLSMKCAACLATGNTAIVKGFREDTSSRSILRKAYQRGWLPSWCVPSPCRCGRDRRAVGIPWTSTRFPSRAVLALARRSHRRPQQATSRR